MSKYLNMKNQSELPQRKRLRLQYFDYSTPGSYFITICTYNRKNTLSSVVGAIHESPVAVLKDYGKVVDGVIRSLPDRFDVIVDRYVIMPNHIHMIVVIADNDESPLRVRSVISKVVGYIKMTASKEIHSQFGNCIVWQRGFHDHIIRNKEDYKKIAEYICENPKRWIDDCLYQDE